MYISFKLSLFSYMYVPVCSYVLNVLLWTSFDDNPAVTNAVQFAVLLYNLYGYPIEYNRETN
jgi:hypothetical protein